MEIQSTPAAHLEQYLAWRATQPAGRAPAAHLASSIPTPLTTRLEGLVDGTKSSLTAPS